MDQTEGSADAPQKLYDLTKLIDISRGNDAFVKKMLILFAERIPPSLGEINTAFQLKDYKKIRDIAHMLKPSIDNMGITSIKTNIRNIEDSIINNATVDGIYDDIKCIEAVLLLVCEQLKSEIR